MTMRVASGRRHPCRSAANGTRRCRELDRAIELRPTTGAITANLATRTTAPDGWTKHVKAYTRVIELQPDSAVGFHNLGTVHQPQADCTRSAGKIRQGKCDSPERRHPARTSRTLHYLARVTTRKRPRPTRQALDLAPQPAEVSYESRRCSPAARTTGGPAPATSGAVSTAATAAGRRQ